MYQVRVRHRPGLDQLEPFFPSLAWTHSLSQYSWLKTFAVVIFMTEEGSTFVANCPIRISPRSQGPRWPDLAVQGLVCGVLEGTYGYISHLSPPKLSGPKDRRSYTAPPTFKGCVTDGNSGTEITREPSLRWVLVPGPTPPSLHSPPTHLHRPTLATQWGPVKIHIYIHINIYKTSISLSSEKKEKSFS